jgi:hypothetical protein
MKNSEMEFMEVVFGCSFPSLHSDVCVCVCDNKPYNDIDNSKYACVKACLLPPLATLY